LGVHNKNDMIAAVLETSVMSTFHCNYDDCTIVALLQD